MPVLSDITVTVPPEASSSLCCTHQRSAVLYCSTCEDGLCDQCLIGGSHHGHKFAVLTDIIEKRIERLVKTFKQLTSHRNKKVDIKIDITKAKQQLQEAIVKEKEQLEKHYQELQDLLEQNKQKAYSIFLAQSNRMMMDLDDLEEDYEQQNVHEIREAGEQLNNMRGSKNAATIQEIQELERNIKNMEDFKLQWERRLLVDTNRLKGLSKSVAQIVRQNKKLMPRPWEFAENLTFDENTSPDGLIISEDKTCVRWSITKKCDDFVANVLSAQSFKGGCHYWEVDVTDVSGWAVGLVEEGWRTSTGHCLGQDKLSWALQSDDDMLLAVYDDEVEIVQDADQFRRLGVFLDYDKGLLMFFNVDSGCNLHTFSARFKKAVFPAFSVDKSQGVDLPLSLCQLVPESSQQYRDVEIEPGVQV